MNRILSVLCLLLCFLGGCSSHKDTAVLGYEFPYTKFTMLDGSERILSEWKGKPVVILFWSEGCSSCEKAIRRIYEEVRPLIGSTDIVFIADSVDATSEYQAVQERIRKPDMKYFIHAFSGNDLADEAYVTFNGDSVPFFVLVNRNGRVTYTGRSSGDVIEFIKAQSKGASLYGRQPQRGRNNY